ncbi:MAG: ABC transporter substrate-binding protein, partial [Psychromonas sp.]
MLTKLLSFCLLFVVSFHLLAKEKVVLQLKWEHEFQFAGYYAAKWQGFYEDQGLDVEIRSAVQADKSIISPSDELKKGNAQFAIGALDILVDKDNDTVPVILASIFQRSPTAIFSLQKTDISSLHKLSQLRIAAPEADFAKTEIAALFRSRGYDLTKIDFVKQPVTIDTLLNNKADAIVTYAISAEFAAKEKGIKLNKLDPAELGLAFYGDSIYTSFEYSKKHPDIVKKFTEASIKGWLYALKHKKEIAQRIADEFPRHLVTYDNIFQYNLFFAEHIDALLEYPEKPLGEVNKDRWFNMNERARALGLVPSHFNDSYFSFAEKEHNKYAKPPVFYLLIILMVFIPIIIILWYRRHKILTILGVLVAIAVFEVQLEQVFMQGERRADQENATQVINSISAKLQGEVQNNLSMLTGFAAYISATPDLSESDFARYAQALFQKDPLLISFAAAKDLVINYVYPLDRNEKAIGLDYKNTPDQLAMVEQVVNTGQVQMVGPVNLVQGGRAFIGRAPI